MAQQKPNESIHGILVEMQTCIQECVDKLGSPDCTRQTVIEIGLQLEALQKAVALTANMVSRLAYQLRQVGVDIPALLPAE